MKKEKFSFEKITDTLSRDAMSKIMGGKTDPPPGGCGTCMASSLTFDCYWGLNRCICPASGTCGAA